MTPFWCQWKLVGGLFLLLFWLPNILICFGFRLHLGCHLAWFLRCLGTLEIKLKRWRGCQNQTLDPFVLSMVSRLDLVTDFLQILEIFDLFWISIWRRFGHDILGIIGEQKDVETNAGKYYARKMTKRGLGPVSPEKKGIFDPLLPQKLANSALDQTRTVCLKARWRI